MAYANLVNIACADKTEFFCRFRDFLCKRNGTYDYSTTGIGWTLIDESYAVDEDNPAINDWFVVMAPGENADFDFYVQFQWTSGYIKTRVGMYWNTATNAFATASDSPGIYTAMLMSEVEAPGLYVWGDLDCVVIGYKGTVSNTVAYGCTHGRIASGNHQTEDILTTTGSSYSAGSDVSITFNEALPADWLADKGIYIWSGDGTELGIIYIKTVNSGTKTITADLAATVSGGTIRCTRHFGFVFCTTYTSITSSRGLMDGNELGNSVITARYVWGHSGANTTVAPDPFDNEYAMSKVYQIGSGGLYGRNRNVRACAHISGLVDGDVMTDVDGTNWRLWGALTGSRVAVKEV